MVQFHETTALFIAMEVSVNVMDCPEHVEAEEENNPPMISKLVLVS